MNLLLHSLLAALGLPLELVNGHEHFCLALAVTKNLLHLS